jgi:hypothetical protein
MSHPENTMRDIIARQEKIIDIIEDIVETMYYEDERARFPASMRMKAKLHGLKKK